MIPWHRPNNMSCEEKPGGSAVGDTTTTTCTSEDDVTHYHAYTQTGSDSEHISSISRYGRGVQSSLSGGLTFFQGAQSPLDKCPLKLHRWKGYFPT